MTVMISFLTLLIIVALSIFPSSSFDVSLSTQAISVRQSTLGLATRYSRRNIVLLHLKGDKSNGVGDHDVDKKSIEVFNSIELPITCEEDNTTELEVTSKDPIAQMVDNFISAKEVAYTFIRKILSDLITIIRRSATKARDWAVEDDIGQLVSSGLFLVGFFALVAAFAAWNIEVLSGGKSKWSGPQSGITVPMLKTPESPSEISFQKPKWKAPKIQTSYSTIDETKNEDF